MNLHTNMDLRKKVISALSWKTSVNVANQFLQVVFTALLARLLSKSDFGILAMALVVTRFMQALTSIGFGSAIIQSQEITERQISAIFYINLLVCFLSAGLCCLFAPLVAVFFHNTSLTSVVRVISLTLFFNGFLFPDILLRKKLDFKAVSIREFISLILSNVIGVLLAFMGWGVWSLVIRNIMQKVASAIFIWFYVRWWPRNPDFRNLKRYIHFGLHMLGSKLLNYFSSNIISIIIGRYIGAETLGVFNIAYNLAILPAQKIRDIFASVLTPTFSMINTNFEKFFKKFEYAFFNLSFFYIPAMFFLAGTSENLIEVLYGEKWIQAGNYLTFLAVVGLLRGLIHFFNSVIVAKGHSLTILVINIIQTVSMIPLLIFGLKFFKIQGLIGAYLISSLIVFVISIIFLRYVFKPYRMSMRSFVKGTLFSFCIAIAIYLFAYLFHWNMILELFLQGLIGIVFYFLLSYIFLDQKEREDLIFSKLLRSRFKMRNSF